MKYIIASIFKCVSYSQNEMFLTFQDARDAQTPAVIPINNLDILSNNCVFILRLC